LQRLKRPTQDGSNYEPYFVKTIAVENGNSLIVTCIDEEAKIESIDRLNGLIASNYVLGENDFRFDDIESLNATQFRLSGDLREIIGEITRAGCISKILKEQILQDESLINYYLKNKIWKRMEQNF
jgi:hypothetical protein